MNYSVDVVTILRGGEVFYKESENILPFNWEYTTAGISIYVPSKIDWEVFCEKHSADWAKERRGEILQRLSEEMRKQNHLKGGIEIGDTWIDISSTG